MVSKLAELADFERPQINLYQIRRVSRKNSHPQLVSMTDLNGNDLDHDKCISRVLLSARTLREIKSNVIITAKDISKLKLVIYRKI